MDTRIIYNYENNSRVYEVRAICLPMQCAFHWFVHHMCLLVKQIVMYLPVDTCTVKSFISTAACAKIC